LGARQGPRRGRGLAPKGAEEIIGLAREGLKAEEKRKGK